MSENPLLDIEHLNSEPISQGTAVSALALNFAMKYHDINTVQDGTLYQQYKLEGRNMQTLHLDMIFETARRFEAWIIGSPNRLSAMIIEGVAEVLLDDQSKEPQP